MINSRRTIHRLAAAALMGAALAGCASTQNMALTGASGQSPEMFPISAEQADRVLAVAMAGEFSDAVISRVELPYKGYTTTIRVLFDSHQITALMVPAKGKSGDQTVDGFYFQVNDAGTLLFSGKARARGVFSRVLHEAQLVTKPLPLARAS
ncbi:hypothetical protein [Comamonas sp.]|uniref:hypothetical protein n=1 Tax=Comamonas sp. TaxID=34028 RepID=UPI0028992579|nr:hypothetical protein [Comamonas sp.]